MPTFIKAIIIIAVVLVAVMLLLFVAARLLGYGSIGALLQHIGEMIAIMWERIRA